MGYSHAWYVDEAAPGWDDAFGAFAADAQVLYSAAARAGIRLAGPGGTGAPVASADLVTCNGPGADGYEAFWLPRRHPEPFWPGELTNSSGAVVLAASPRPFASVKTNRHRYDPIVCALLIRAAHRFGDAIWIDSDGDWAAWTPGRTLVHDTFGAPPGDVLTSNSYRAPSTGPWPPARDHRPVTTGP